MKFFKPGCLLIFMLLSSSTLFAQMGTHFVMQHLRPTDAAVVAMAYGGTAFRNGHWAPYSNPAGLATLEQPQFGYTYQPSHQLLFLSNENFFGQQNFSISLPLNKLKLGFYFTDLDLGKQTIADENSPTPQASGDAGARQYQLSLAYQVGIFNQSRLMFGVNSKLLTEDYIISEGNAKLFDLGLRADFVGDNRTFTIGTSVTNLGQDMEYKMLDGGIFKEEMIKLLKTGIAFQNTGSGANSQENIGYLLSVEYQRNIDARENFKDLWEILGYGAEVKFFDHLYAQFGYVQNLTNNDDDNKIEGWTWGFGFKTPRPVNLYKPVYLGLSYGRGVEIGLLDMNVLLVSVSLAK